MKDWQRFVLAYGWKAHHHELAAVVVQSAVDVLRLRASKACTRRKKVKRFAELFALWHGRPPRDDEWPMPRRSHRGSYNWQAPELALLASLVGRLGKPEISRILTRRLQKRTGDRGAGRSPLAVQMAINHRLGMQTSDIVGGISITDAGREIGSYAMVFQAIERRELRAFRVGRRWVVPHDAWRKWKASRVFPPAGYVQLSTLKRPLGIRSDKLSEWARMGYVPTAMRCNPYGARAKNTKFGSWYIAGKVARKLIAGRRAGSPMPWWGKPEPSNLRITWKLLEERRHPAACRTCAQIWGHRGAPRTYGDYAERYPPIAHGAKRHLTRKWSPGLTMKQVAKMTRRSWGGVRLAVKNGLLPAVKLANTHYISRTEATRWKTRGCPGGGDQKSWISVAGACLQHEFKRGELLKFIADGHLRSKVGTNGPMRGIIYVLRHQVKLLRERLGFSVETGARRAGMSVARFRRYLEGVNWRGVEGIPLDTVNAVIKRLESKEGYTIQEAAAAVRTTESWVKERILDGTIRVQRAKWDLRRIYITEPMLKRLRQVKRKPIKRENFTDNWLFLGQAAKEAGVSLGQMNMWGINGELPRRKSHLGWRYPRRSVRARARLYWKKPRLKRAVPPTWLQPKPAANDDHNSQRLAA